MSILYRPRPFRFSIPQGQHFHHEFLEQWIDTNTGAPFQFLTQGCTARVDVVTETGDPVTAFSSNAATEGQVTLTDDGRVALDMSYANTAQLTPTTEYTGSLHAPVYADLVITHNAIPWLMAKGAGEITRKVTT